MPDDITLHILIRGRVQGVGYRHAMRATALRQGVSGWVRNRADGSVEAMASGPLDAVDALLAWARHGPPGALVATVETAAAAGEFAGFAQRPTL